MKFNICVPIPIKSGNFDENTEIIKNALNTNPDLIELRFDYIDELQNITPNFIKSLLDLIQPNIPAIITFRDPKEGGQIEIDKNKHLKIIGLLVEAKPKYLDFEMNSDIRTLQNIINLTNKFDVNLIFSYHDFKETPSYDEIVKILEGFKDTLLNNHLIDFMSFKQIVFKLIFTAQKFEDNIVTLKLCQSYSEKDQKIISFCMGEKGFFSRVSCVKVGSFLTFASFKEETAPGQIKISQMREFHQLLFNK